MAALYEIYFSANQRPIIGSLHKPANAAWSGKLIEVWRQILN